MSAKRKREAAHWERAAEMCLDETIGICQGVGRVVKSNPMKHAMWRRIDEYMHPSMGWAYPAGYMGLPKDSDREARCLAALWLAQDALHGVPVFKATP